MIKVNIKNNIIIITGHAGYDDFGKDIVCASVSSIVITSINLCLRFNKESIKYKEEKDNLTNEHDLQLKNLHEIILGVRPEDVYIENDINNKNPSASINIECDVAELLGHETIVYGYIGGQRVVIKTSSANEINQGDKLIYQFDMNKVHFFDPTTTNRI